MSQTPPTLNGLRALSVRLFVPWRGPWTADVDLDPEQIAQAPTSGPASLVVGGQTLVGTVDPRYSGSFVASGRARVVGGGGGWDKPVVPQNWQSDGGVTSSLIFTATAGLVGEKIVDQAPEAFTSFVRDGGEAARVFRDRDWWVDFTGTTQVGTRAPATADTTLELLEWDASEQRATVACDALIVPGTVLADPRLNGISPTVRTVEQTFSKEVGARATLWCAAQAVDPLLAALTGLVRKLAGTERLKAYRYRIALQGADGRVQLQAIDPGAGMPDTLPVEVLTGMQGVFASHMALGGECSVVFMNGDPSQPRVHGFRASDIPLELDLNASALVKLAGGATPLVLAPWATGLITGLAAMASALASATTVANVAAAGSALASALSALPSPATMKVVGQ